MLLESFSILQEEFEGLLGDASISKKTDNAHTGSDKEVDDCTFERVVRFKGDFPELFLVFKIIYSIYKKNSPLKLSYSY